MFPRNAISSAILVICLTAMTLTGTTAFTTQSVQSRAQVASSPTALSVFGKKKEVEPEDDLSWMETRDMTREEMIALNARNEKVMNNELGAMTAVSVLFSLPMFYLCWVAFFSE